MRETFETAKEEGRMEMAQELAIRMLTLGYPFEFVQIMFQEEFSKDDLIQIQATFMESRQKNQ